MSSQLGDGQLGDLELGGSSPALSATILAVVATVAFSASAPVITAESPNVNVSAATATVTVQAPASSVTAQRNTVVAVSSATVTLQSPAPGVLATKTASIAAPAAAVSVSAPTPGVVITYVDHEPDVLGYSHEFTPPGGVTRTLPTGGQVVSGFRSLAVPQGGLMSATAEISADEIAANPSTYVYGTVWRVKNLDDNGRTIFGGTLLEPEVNGGVAVLQAQGWGKKAEKTVRHLVWQTRDGEHWAPGDSDPFPYDADDKIEASVKGNRLAFRVRRATVFKKKAGVPASWASSVVCYIEGVGLSRIAFDYDANIKDDYSLEICKANGPSGSLTVVSTLDLSATKTGSVDVGITGTNDLLALRLRRSVETKKADNFKLNVSNVRVNGPFGNLDTRDTSTMMTDVATIVGGDTTDIQATARNGLPLMFLDTRAADAADVISLLDDRAWGIYDEGSGAAWKYRNWGDRTWNLTDPHSPVSLLPAERYTVVVIPYKSKDGVRRTARYSVPGINGISNELRIPFEEPFPTKDVADIIGPILAASVADTQFGGRATFVSMEDPAKPGVDIAATRIKPGDKLTLTNHGSFSLRVADVEIDGSIVTVTFPTENTSIERMLTLRQLLMARGRSNRRSTLGAIGLKKPAVPTNVVVGFVEAEKRGGKRKFHADVDWDAVTLDVDSNATAIRAYIVEAEPGTVSGGVFTAIPKSQGGGRRKIRVTDKDTTDSNDDAPTSVVIPHLEHPHKWYWRIRVYAEDVLGKHSDATSWTPHARPAAFGPPAPTGLTLTKHRSKLELEFEANDPDETETDGSPMLNRGIARFKIKKYRNDVQRGKTVRTQATSKTWRLIKPINGTWKCDVWSVDHYGNESAVATVSVNSRKPGKARNVRTIPKTRGIRAKWDAPSSWSDGSIDDWDETEVESYTIVLKRSGMEVDRTERNKARAAWFPMTKAEAALSGYTVEVEAVGHEEETDGFQVTIDAAQTPEQISIGSSEIEDGAITYAKIVTSIGAIRIGSTAPSPAKNGDVWYDTSFSPPRLKRYDGASWVELIKGPDIVANAITADKIAVSSLDAISANIGTITAGTLTGVTIVSSSGSSFVSINATDGFKVSDSGFTRGIIKWASTGMVLQNGSGSVAMTIAGGSGTPSLGFYGVTPTTRISMTNLASGASLSDTVTKVNNLLDNLRTTGLIS